MAERATGELRKTVQRVSPKENLSLIRDMLPPRSVLSGSQPIYMELATGIGQLIESEKLPDGSRLPTVRELAASLSLSRGTVKHAYNRLEQQGLVSLTQGKGSFVTYLPDKGSVELSRKEQAMGAIDLMLDELNEMGFRRREIQIFLELKLRERDEHSEDLSIMLVANSPEERSIMLNAFSALPDLELFAYPFDDLLAGRISTEDFDAVVATEEVYRAIKLQETSRDSRSRLFLLGLCASPLSLISLARLPEDRKVGILSLSRTYGGELMEACVNYAHLSQHPELKLFHDKDIFNFIQDREVILVPAEYMGFIQQELNAALKEFVRRGGELILFRMDCERASLTRIREELEAMGEQRRQCQDSSKG